MDYRKIIAEIERQYNGPTRSPYEGRIDLAIKD